MQYVKLPLTYLLEEFSYTIYLYLGNSINFWLNPIVFHKYLFFISQIQIIKR